MENTDLLGSNTKRKFNSDEENKTNGAVIVINKESETLPKPPDGGARAWSVMIGAFLINGLLFGIINSYSVVYLALKEQLVHQNVTEADSKASLVGALSIGTTFLLSLVSGVLTDAFGLRRTAMLGGLLAAGGMLLSSLVPDSVEALYFTYGIMFGLGAALAYTPSLAILGHYFQRYLGLVNGVVTAGSSVFTIIMPKLLNYVIKTSGLVQAYRVLAAMAFGVSLCAVLFKPLRRTSSEKEDTSSKSCSSFLNNIVDIKIWKNKRYVIWTLSLPIALLGYFVPYVHMGEFISHNFHEKDKELAIQCIGATSGLGRLVFGYIADKPKVNRIILQQISFYCIGIVTIILPFVNNYEQLIVIALLMGIFDGCFISLLGPVAFDLCGAKGATQAIGCLLGLASIPLSFGPPIAGYIYGKTNSYTLPFVLAGLPPIFGATILWSIRWVKATTNEDDVVFNDTKVKLLKTLPENKDANCKNVNGVTSPNEASVILASTESLEEADNVIQQLCASK